MSSLDQLLDEVSTTTTVRPESSADFHPIPTPPRPGVYPVLRLAATGWRWELVAWPDLRTYYRLQGMGDWGMYRAESGR